jgi:hypothetical protein
VFKSSYRPILGIQWVVWTIKSDDDRRLRDFLLVYLRWRGVATVTDHTMDAIPLIACEYCDLFTGSQRQLTELVLCNDACECVA